MDSMLDRGDVRGMNGSPNIYPSSEYLAEKLQQRRASVARPKRTRHTDIGPWSRLATDDDIFLNEAEEEARNERARLASSVASLTGSHSRGASRTESGVGRRSLGIRSMDEKMDRLTKDNFALKMEVDQRRQYTNKLQEQMEEMDARLERFERLQEEQANLWRINDQLVRELEKRDRAVEEAIDTICELEEKVAELEERRSTSSTTRPSTAHADSGYAGTETHELAPQPSPPKLVRPPKVPHADRRPSTAAASAATGRLRDLTGVQTPARSRREPSMLSAKKTSSQALRSVFLDNSQSLNGVKSFISLLKERESTVDEGEEEPPNSPRLSVLSESSFPSMYGSHKKRQTPRQLSKEMFREDAPQSPFARFQQDSINRVSQWINDGQAHIPVPPMPRTRSASSSETERDVMPASPSKRPGDEARFRSIADALTTSTTVRGSDEVFPSVPYSEPPKAREPRPLRPRQPRPTSFAGPVLSDSSSRPGPDQVDGRLLRGSRSTVTDNRVHIDIRQISGGSTSHASATERPTRTTPNQTRSSAELNAAFNSYMERRKQESATEDERFERPIALPTHRPPYDSVAIIDDEESAIDDSRSETVHDLSLDYDGFPDGNSIVMGTPSRFLKHGKPPAPPTSNLLFDGNDATPSLVTPQRHLRQQEQLPPKRPQSSSGFTSVLTPGGGEPGKAPRKPSLSRAETSPSYLGATMGKLLRRMSNSSGRRLLR